MGCNAKPAVCWNLFHEAPYLKSYLWKEINRKYLFLFCISLCVHVICVGLEQGLTYTKDGEKCVP